MKRVRLLVASTDHTVPMQYEGKLDPNARCRGWNAKQEKYCAARAGAGTSHPGVGRCRFHGGLKRGTDKRVTNGRESVVKNSTLGALIEAERKRADPLNLEGELATLRALVADLRTRNPGEAQHASELALADAIGRMVERIERIRSQNAISRPELGRIMQELWRALDARVSDEDIKAAIREDWLRVAL